MHGEWALYICIYKCRGLHGVDAHTRLDRAHFAYRSTTGTTAMISPQSYESAHAMEQVVAPVEAEDSAILQVAPTANGKQRPTAAELAVILVDQIEPVENSKSCLMSFP